jgi:formate hydrogenlyase subunit 3/multisubunit Na+/H+ antiporter MnhD subunit
MVIVNGASCAASLYAIGHCREESEPARVLTPYALFLLGMNLVLVADDAFSFLLAWEFMSLASWALVVVRHRDEENRRAGLLYVVMAAFGTLALLFAFGVLAGGEGAYTFDAVRARQLSPLAAGLTLLLVTVGTGSKSGLVPLHAWLPPAHSAAPSHVSALMSGVMTKVAVYGFVRIVFDLLGTPAWWWSMLILALGGITAVLGVLYALMQHDLKRLLAYHTVENIGIIYIGLGLALAFDAYGMRFAAALALTAALFHVFNHCVFKSLLFFGAGAVQSATGERDMEHLGGLIHRMPRTAFLFLTGCVAISALPPLNGFVSEWLTFQAILISPELPNWGLKFLVPAVGALLALSAALAAACFVKAFGVSFLGRPRTSAAEGAHEADGFSLAAMGALAMLCALAGIFPGLVIDLLSPAVSGLLGSRMPVQASLPWQSIVPVAESRSSYSGLVFFLFIAVAATLAALAIHRFASNRVRRAPAWDCGFPDSDPATQYSASSFAQPIRRVFGSVVFRASEKVEMPAPGEPGAARLQVELRDLIWDYGYAPVAASVLTAAERLNPLQFQTIRRYLALVFAALVTLLLVLSLWP